MMSITYIETPKETGILDFRKTAAGIIVSFSFAFAQTAGAVVEAEALPRQLQNMSNPDYPAFSLLVEEYNLKSNWLYQGTMQLLLRGREAEWEAHLLTGDILTHPGRPADFSYDDLGQVGCMPGSGGSDGKMGQACHAICREEEDSAEDPAVKNSKKIGCGVLKR